jgi:UDP-N-acetylmuramate dehydrogenase
MNIRENEPLSRHTTLRTGGPARYFIEAASVGEIREALDFARQKALPVFVLGGGSNVLVSDTGFTGVVVKLATRGLAANDASTKLPLSRPSDTLSPAQCGGEVGERGGSPLQDLTSRPVSEAQLVPNTTEVVAEAGEEWDALVAFAVERGLAGLENMSLIPGTVGAAVIGNIGAYGTEVKDSLAWAETIDRRNGTIRRMTNRECQFAYRHSFFKTVEGRHHIVLRAAFALSRMGVLNTRYRDLREYFAAHGITAPTLADVRDAVISIRQRKLPDPVRVGTAGSFFKNPVMPRAQYEALAAKFPGLPGYDDGPERVKAPLGWILDKICGLKGARRGPVGTHPEQALCLINDGGTASEVAAFADDLTRQVHDKTGLVIEWEVERI